MKCLDFLDKGLESDEKHKVVVSHHVPARSCVAPRYLDSPLTDAFCANLDNLLSLGLLTLGFMAIPIQIR